MSLFLFIVTLYVLPVCQLSNKLTQAVMLPKIVLDSFIFTDLLFINCFNKNH